MAEIKNTFIKSKMNKDLDDRLVPSGEYRDALNIAISRSEGENVGALENILGNDLIFDEENEYTCIGRFADTQSNVIYYFVTNYIDSSPSGLDNFAPPSAHCSIRSYNIKTNLRTILVQGSFLNFSARSQITGINIIEDLLFWTDNRNQPRKINIKSATSFPAAPPQSGRTEDVVIPQAYYVNEDQISVAKYYPWKPIILVDIYNTSVGNTPDKSTMTNPSQQYIPIDDPSGNFQNPDYDANWPGDPNYLEEKFIKLSYRFKFDDNEYSLMAPFTQACFIPKQNGYFLNDDNEKSYRSSIVDFFENNVTQIIASIQFETRNPYKDLRIKELDILYKESDSLQVKVIETISIEEVQRVINENFARTGNGYIYNYKYISTKPYKSLPEEQIVRVYDKVPTRALSQEVAGNRVIYGNFYTTQSPPKSLDYYVTYGSKTSFLGYSQIEYPNHTVKQNRNYQVGFVLADRFGRQSSVILSSNDDGITNAGSFYGGSTVYVPYSTASLNPIDWPGYALKALVNSPIPSSEQYNGQGYPGLYKDESRSVDYTILEDGGSGYNPAAKQTYQTTGGTGTGLTISGVVDGTGVLTGAQIVNPGSGYTDGDLVEVVNPNPGITTNATVRVTVLKPNPLGWYSYKIVVRQTEQDYYNVYLPGILNGYPRSYVDSEGNVDIDFEQNETSNVILINDNINKIPRDLSEVGPDQKQYRSSVRLFGRVAPVDDNAYNYNKQYYPGSNGDNVVSISTLADTNYNGTTLGDITTDNGSNVAVSRYSLNYPEFYQSNTNPLVARVETKKAIGKKNVNPVTTYQNQLAVYETKAVESLLDIYWETTSSGLISELNQLVIDGGFEGAVNHAGYNWAWDEGDPGGTNIFQAPVYVINGFGNIMFSDIVFELNSVFNGEGDNKTSDFVLTNTGTGTPADPNGFQITTDQDLIVYCGPNRDITNFTFNIRATYTNPSTLEVTTTNIIITDEVANKSAIFVQDNTVCPPTEYPIGYQFTFTPDSPINGDALIATFYGVNGVNCESEQQRDDITFSYFPNQFPNSIGYFIPGGANAPGTTSMYIRENVIPNYVNFDLFVRDARGEQSYVNIDLTIGASDQISIEYGNLCDLGEGSSGSGTPHVWTLNNGWNGGHSRLPITIGGLTGGVTYSFDFDFLQLVGSDGTPSVQNIDNCGFPGGLSGTFTQPVSETTSTFYIELVYTGNSLQDLIRFSLNVQDTSTPPIAQQVTREFSMDGNQAYLESNSPCSIVGPGELCPPPP